MKNLLIFAGFIAACAISFFFGGGYALKQRAKEQGYDCVVHVNLAEERETGASVIRNLKYKNCATVRVIGYTINK